MTAILPCDVSATCESEENFVDQCGRLKRMVWPLATHVLDSYLLKVRINQRDKSVAGRSVTVLHLFQHECDLIRLCLAHIESGDCWLLYLMRVIVGTWRDNAIELKGLLAFLNDCTGDLGIFESTSEEPCGAAHRRAPGSPVGAGARSSRSEERRVGKECRFRSDAR